MNRDFGWALAQLKAGLRVRRQAWDEGVEIALKTPTGNSKMTEPFIYIRAFEGKFLAPWTLAADQVLAEDWELAPL